MALELILVRHGKSRINDVNDKLPPNERIMGEGNLENELNETGREQARLLGKFFMNYFDSSPLLVSCSEALRCIDTCEISFPATEYVVSRYLNEQHKGDWEGKRVCDVITPEIEREIERLYWYHKPPNGESRDDTYRRGNSFLEEEILRKGYGVAILFTHLNFIRDMVTGLLSLDKRFAYKIPVGNVSVTILQYDGEWKDQLVYYKLENGIYQRIVFEKKDGKLEENGK